MVRALAPYRPGSSRALYFAIFCGSARALGGTGSRSVARLAKYCGLVKRQTGHAFLNAQWVCLLICLFVIKVAGVMKSLFVYLLLDSGSFRENL